MTEATYLLFCIGVLGAFDTQYFHNTTHRLREHSDSRLELIVHSLRGPTYGSLFVLIPNFAMLGSYFWLLIFLLFLETAISIWDFFIEGESRRRYGGLPSGEYVLHIIIATLFGAMTACVFWDAFTWTTQESQILWQPAGVHWTIRLVMAGMALALLVSSVQDAYAALRMGKANEASQ